MMFLLWNLCYNYVYELLLLACITLFICRVFLFIKFIGIRVWNFVWHFPNRSWGCYRCQLKLTSYSPSFPTCMSHPRKCAPSLLNSPSTPTSLLGLQQQGEQEVSEPCSCSLAPSRINSQQFSHLERMLMGLTTRLFNILWA
jgi:hypothetical protein